MNNEKLGIYKAVPSHEKYHTWEAYSKELDVEYKQTMEEGKDIEAYKGVFDAVIAMPDGVYKEKIADTLYEIVANTPIKEDYPHYEPSTLEGIKAERRPFPLELKMPEEEVLNDKILGAWYGRICGCLLGKPVEGIMSWDLKKILERTGNYPMTRYIDKEEITDEVQEGVDYNMQAAAYPRDFGRMPPDDDTNYMIIGYRILQIFGPNFTSENVARLWLDIQIERAYCTAERVAYRNFVAGYLPPDSAVYKNPYREWIGAQIRGDFFGYFNPCNPELAAEMAHRDASISHVKNGIYGEMWVSAMLAAAYGCDDIESIIRRGLAEVPANSRLYKAVEKILADYHSGITIDQCFEDIHARWDERNGHDWTHTVSNAEIVTASLLWGGGDYAKSVGYSVQVGYDTDCNGATVGSILGVMKGYEALPREFTDRVCDTLDSNIIGFHRVSIKDMAKRTADLIKHFNNKK
ncbi:MAG: ADP-ribosylglycohydrolase family protein [Ruminococcaceae bacterium]|nr:ADP-ribosylglycohydrolase family protein [Oscillospiraceae bacterium]